MSSDDKSLMDLAYDERVDLAAFLESLTPQDWDAPTLCEKWTVKMWWLTSSATRS